MTRLPSWAVRVNARCACALLLVVTAGAPQVRGDWSASQTPAGATTEQVNPEAEWFDRSVRPQDDFFQHVNGGWIKAAQIPADRPSYGVIQQVRLKVERDLQAIFDDIAGSNAPEGDWCDRCNGRARTAGTARTSGASGGGSAAPGSVLFVVKGSPAPAGYSFAGSIKQVVPGRGQI